MSKYEKSIAEKEKMEQLASGIDLAPTGEPRGLVNVGAPEPERPLKQIAISNALHSLNREIERLEFLLQCVLNGNNPRAPEKTEEKTEENSKVTLPVAEIMEQLPSIIGGYEDTLGAIRNDLINRLF